ncbi:MAG TPA: hypothetical protein VJ761_17710, partial [Ktedonobacteraceae bacterium]|nr:hypothetical protein [Ktedonobacteraceae bacterium]
TQQSNISPVQEKLQGFEGTLKTKQKELKLSYAASQNINVAFIKAHMEHLEQILDGLETLPDEVSPDEGKKIAAKSDAIGLLEEILNELAVALKNCERLESLANKSGKEVADDIDATTTHLFGHIQKCRRPLVQAEVSIRTLREVLS